MSEKKYASVLVDINKLGTKTFSYLIPDSMKKDIKIGQSVSVPFGRRKENLKAYVVGFNDYLEDGIKAKEITHTKASLGNPLFVLFLLFDFLYRLL